MGKSQDLYKKAKMLIPGGTQLLSKRPEMFLPDIWPAYYEKAEGCDIWDLDGNKYIDMSLMGVGSCILGYADKDVNAAVKSTIDKGSMSTLNCPDEVALAKTLCEIHPWAKMVRYSRTGGEAVAIAARIARAATGRDLILFCGYHGWHDWYLSANIDDNRALDGHLLPGLNPLGVPRALKGTAISFEYNNIDDFLSLIGKYGKNIAAVVMEPLRNCYPDKGFLETIKVKTEELGIVLVFDEITSGWRLIEGGAQLKLGIDPDIAVFAKAMGNGYPMSAVIGVENIMGIAQDTFISSTYWTEGIGPAAALATIDKLRKENVSEHLTSIGEKVQRGWRQSAKNSNLDISISGIYPLGHFSFNCEDKLAAQTLFTQLMLEKGFLATTAFYASYAHKEAHIAKYLDAVGESFAFISKAINGIGIRRYLKGPICHSGFKRLN